MYVILLDFFAVTCKNIAQANIDSYKIITKMENHIFNLNYLFVKNICLKILVEYVEIF